MGPIEALKKLGYSPNSNYDWFAQDSDGVCLILWRDEIVWQPQPARLDTRTLANTSDWRSDPKSFQRIEALEKAIQQFSGRLDVVVRNGNPVENDGSAFPWDIKIRKHMWHCAETFPETNDFILELRPL